jgi:hypothetical protein
MGIPSTLDVWPDSAAGVLAAARDRRRVADLAEADLCRLAVEWAVRHPAESIDDAATLGVRGFGQTDLQLAGEGAPSIAEYAVAEFAAAVGLSTEAGKRLLGECLELRYRLPRVWARVCTGGFDGSGGLVAWKARLVARETIRLTPEAAGWVDRQVAPVAHKLKPTQLERLVNEAIGRFMPDELERLAAESWDRRHVTIHDQLVSYTGTMAVTAELDIADALDLETAVSAGAALRADLGSTESLDVRRAQAVGDLARGQEPLDLVDPESEREDEETAARPQVTPRQPRQVIMHVHLSAAALDGSDPVARLERGNSLVTADQIRSWCGRPDTQVTVKLVIDLNTCLGSDSDTVPATIKEQIDLRDQTCVFPWCTRPARTCRPDDPGSLGTEHACDHDHVIPRARNGPTCSCNLAPLCRQHHRLKTHTGWIYTVIDPGTYRWTSPHGYTYLRDPHGTRDVSADVSADASTDRRRTPET